MGNLTENLNLYLTDMDTDGNDLFDFDRDLNQNFLKIDNAVALKLNKSDIPSQTGKKGNCLTTNGENLEWKQLSGMPIGTIYPLACSANYVPEGSLPCDGAEYTKAQFNDLWGNYLSKNVFDISNFTIVGTPTITNDGIVSDFSTSNYVKTGINIDGSTIKIREKFHISTFENTTISELYRSNYFVLMIGTGSNYNLRARVGNADENNWLAVNYTMLPNKDYVGECIINKTTKLATLNLYDENNNLLGSYTNSTPFESITLADEDNTVTIGYGNNRAFTNGSIDLKYFSITVDGVEVFNPTTSLLNACTYSEYASDITTYGQCGKFAVKPLVFDSSKISIVGTPTITGDGILQNYGNSTNYITIDTSSFNSDLETKILKLKYRAKLWSNTDQKTIEIGNDFGTTGLNIGNGNANGSLYIQIVNETSQAMSISGTDLNNHLGELYNAEFISNGTNYSFKITFDDGAVFEVSSAITTPLVLPSVLNVGKINNYLAGQIDLKYFSITVDGKEVYNCVSGNTFKVPTIKDGAYITQAKNDTELGKSCNESLPNLKGNLSIVLMGKDTNASSGVFGGSTHYTNQITIPSGSNQGSADVNFNASGYSSVYKDNAKVQGDNIRLRYFVVVASGSVNESQMNWNEWASSLQNKADKNAVDGQYVTSRQTLSTTDVLGSYTIDLSSYLPNDGAIYQIFGDLTITRKDSSNANSYYYLSTNAIDSDAPGNSYDILKLTVQGGTSSSDYAENNASWTAYIGVERKLHILLKNTKLNVSSLVVHGYRRIGTNV